MEWFLKVARLVFEPSHLKANYNALNTMYLIVIATKILEQEGLGQEDQRSVCSWVKDVCRLRLTTIDGRTFLHICVDAETNQTINYFLEDICRYVRYVFRIFMLEKAALDDFSLDFRMNSHFDCCWLAEVVVWT